MGLQRGRFISAHSQPQLGAQEGLEKGMMAGLPPPPSHSHLPKVSLGFLTAWRYQGSQVLTQKLAFPRANIPRLPCRSCKVSGNLAQKSMQHPSVVFYQKKHLYASSNSTRWKKKLHLQMEGWYIQIERGGIDSSHLEDKVSHTSSVSIRWLWKKFPLSFPIQNMWILETDRYINQNQVLVEISIICKFLVRARHFSLSLSTRGKNQEGKVSSLLPQTPSILPWEDERLIWGCDQKQLNCETDPPLVFLFIPFFLDGWPPPLGKD